MLTDKEAYEYLQKEYDAAIERGKQIGHKGKSRYVEALKVAMDVIERNGDVISTSQEHFGTLAICAIRYCHGRQTYMPSLVQGIVGAHLKEVSDKDLSVMIDDCDFQERMNLYGSDSIDKLDWLNWKKALLSERERRNNE